MEDTAELRTALVLYVKHSPQHGLALSVGQLPDNDIAALLFDRCQKYSSLLMAANRVYLPMPELDTLRNNDVAQVCAAAENTLVFTRFAVSATTLRVFYSLHFGFQDKVLNEN